VDCGHGGLFLDEIVYSFERVSLEDADIDKLNMIIALKRLDLFNKWLCRGSFGDANFTCVLGPTGVNKKVALLYEIDPYMGVLRLVPFTQQPGVEDHENAVGLASVIRCRNESNERVWLIDGVDVGVMAEYTGRAWQGTFLQGIIDAAIDAEDVDRICFNAHVKNPNNKLFNKFLESEYCCRRHDVYLKKIGGNKALTKRNLRRPEHYIEAFHYSTGSVWSESCEGVARVLEVPL